MIMNERDRADWNRYVGSMGRICTEFGDEFLKLQGFGKKTGHMFISNRNQDCTECYLKMLQITDSTKQDFKYRPMYV